MKQGILDGDIPDVTNLLRPWVLGFNPTWDLDGIKTSFTRFKIRHDKDLNKILEDPKIQEQLDTNENWLAKDEIQLPDRECIGFLLGPLAKCHTLSTVHIILKIKE